VLHAGESTRGLPSPQYGELKNFGYVPKPGSSIIMYDWQRFVPTSVLTQHIPADVLSQYLDNDTLAMLAPDAKGDVQTQRTLVGWQRAIPASVIQQYVPADVLAKYVPEGVVMATTGPTDSPLSKSAQHAAAASEDDKQSSTAAAAPAAASSDSSAAPVTDSSIDPVVATAAAVQKPHSGLAGLLDDLRGSRSNEQQQPLPTTAYIVPVQQVQPTSTMQMQQPQHMMLVQPADGGPAYYMPVTAVQPANAPIGQQQFVATSVQQQQQVFLAPGTSAAVRPAPAAGFAGSNTMNSFQQGPTVAGSYPGYGPAVGARAGPTVVGAAGPSRDMQEALDRHNIYRSVTPHWIHCSVCCVLFEYVSTSAAVGQTMDAPSTS
jgi:hypothetical protein